MSEKSKPITEDARFLHRVLLDDGEILSGNYWNELRIFLAVAKGRSFNRAAEMLGISAPTVGRRVRRLQDVIGTELFTSSVAGTQLTPQGVDLAVQVARLDTTLRDITKSLGDGNEQAIGDVRVAMTEGIAVCIFGGVVAELARTQPSVTITLNAPRNIHDLRDNNADMMVSFIEDRGSDVVCQRLGTLHMLPAASRSYIESYGTPTKDNIHEHVFLNSPLYAATNIFWQSWTEIIKRGRVVHATENSIFYYSMTSAGLGIALLNSVVTVIPNIVPIDLGLKLQVPLFATISTEAISQPAPRIVFEKVCEFFSDENPWLQKEFAIDHPPSKYDESFRAAFNV